MTAEIVVATVVGISEAAVIHFDGSVPVSGDGLSWKSAARTIDEGFALATALGATELWVREGLYVPSSAETADPRTRRFLVPSGVALVGGFAGTERSLDERDIDAHPTVLSGDLLGNDRPGFFNRTDNAFHVVRSPSNATLTLDGLTIRSGAAIGTTVEQKRGAGVSAVGGAVTVRRCRFEEHIASERGGGVHIEGGTSLIDACRFIGNRTSGSSGGGGGGLSVNGGVATITASLFTGNDFTNFAGLGVGALVTSPTGPTVIDDCDFVSNFAIQGAANLIGSATLATTITLTNTRFLSNQTIPNNPNTNGAGLVLYGPTLVQAAIEGCEFRANNANSSGGGAWMIVAHVEIDGCSFRDNTALISGGGVNTGTSKAVVRDCLFEGNSAGANGGGLGGAIESIDGCTFRNNAAQAGGGGLTVVVPAGQPTMAIRDSLVESNLTDTDGGGVQLIGPFGTFLIFERSVVRNNLALGKGGGVACTDGSLIFRDSLIAANHAATGGAIHSPVGSLAIERTTVADNTATASTGGILKAQSTLAVKDSIVWGNVSNGVGGYASQITLQPGSSLSVVASDVEGIVVGATVIAADPLFIDPDGRNEFAEDDYALQPSSPCVNRGDPTQAPTPQLDLFGHARFQQCRVDMGAIESPFPSAELADCNGNGAPDECDLFERLDGDCDGDGVPNACEIAAGLPDCDENGVPDPCEVGPLNVDLLSPVFAPFGTLAPATFTIPDAPIPLGGVSLLFTARSDLGATNEFVTVFLNTVSLGNIFVVASDCPIVPNTATITLTATQWRAIVQDGPATILMQASPAVASDECSSFISVEVKYFGTPLTDVNGDGVPDACVIGDLNGDGIVSSADLATLLGVWGPCEGCEADLDHDGVVGAADLAALLGEWS